MTRRPLTRREKIRILFRRSERRFLAACDAKFDPPLDETPDPA